MNLNKNAIWIAVSTAAILLLSLAGLTSCCGNRIDKQVKRAAADGKITQSEWQSLVEAAQCSKDFTDDAGNIDQLALKAYVEKFAKEQMRGIPSLDFDPSINFSGPMLGGAIAEAAPIKFKLYLERSGSMTAYDAANTSGQFKKAITTLLNSIPENKDPNSKNLLYIVNDAVYNYDRTYKDFLTSKNIFADTKDIGDPRYTDFTCIFDSILSRTGQNEMSILVSDLIYSTKEMESVNPQKILNEAEALTTTIFKDHKGLDVTVLKLKSDYKGNYYPYNSPSKGQAYSGDRPWYIMLVASPAVMHRVLSDEKYADFRNFRNLEGFEDYYCFSAREAMPDYSVLLNDSKSCGRFRAAKGQGEEIHHLTDFDADRDGVRSFAVAADLSDVMIPEGSKADAKNYVINSNSGFILEEVVPLTEADMNSDLKRAVPNATHKFIITSRDKIKNRDKVTISFPKVLPPWIEESSTDDDTNIHGADFDSKTFAFKELMKGIYNSFVPSSKESNEFTLTVEVEK